MQDNWQYLLDDTHFFDFAVNLGRDNLGVVRSQLDEAVPFGRLLKNSFDVLQK